MEAVRSRLGLAVSCLALAVALVGVPTADSQSVPDPSVPAGTITAYAGTSIPPGWLPANGDDVSRIQYAALFAAIGTTYGSGSSTTFTLPDLRGRVPVGRGSAPEVDALNDSDALALADRKSVHRHARGSLAVQTGGTHRHQIQMNNGCCGGGPTIHGSMHGLVSWFQDTETAGGPGGSHSHSLTGVIGVDGPMEGPAYGVVNYMIKH